MPKLAMQMTSLRTKIAFCAGFSSLYGMDFSTAAPFAEQHTEAKEARAYAELAGA